MSREDQKTLPIGWTLATIADLVGFDGVFCDGDWVETEDQDPQGDVRLIQLADVGDGNYRDRSNRFLTLRKARELRCTLLAPGDLLIARMPDPLGRACSFPGDTKQSVTVVDICIVRFESPVCSRWVMHQINTPQIRRAIAAHQSGTTRKRISRANLAIVTIPIPPLAEQERITAQLDELLSDLDAGVKALESVRAKLKQYRAAVLKAAVEGTLTAEWRKAHPDVEPASELLERILTERRRRWEEAQLKKYEDAGKEPPENWKARYVEPVAPLSGKPPPLPTNWLWASFDQVAWSLRSGSAQTSQRNVSAYPVLKSSAVRHGRIDFTDLNYYSESTEVRQNNYLASDDLLITRLSGSVDYVGCCAVVGGTGHEDVQYPDRIFCARLGVPAIAPWVMSCFQTSMVRKVLEAAAKSTAGHQRISISDLVHLALPIPPLSEQEAITEAVEAQLSVIDHLESDLEAKLESAQALRQSILKAAFEGKLIPQDPNDEPASELLMRIAAERAERERLAKQAKKPSRPERSNVAGSPPSRGRRRAEV